MKTPRTHASRLRFSPALVLAAWFCATLTPTASAQYPVVDTGQSVCYDTVDEISPPLPGGAFHGQDAQYDGNLPSFTLSGDALTVYDNNTGLTWVRQPDTDGNGIFDSDDKLTWIELHSYVTTLNDESFGGYDDWRVPTIKELYSLIDFSGIDPSGYTGGTSGLIPFIDIDYFDFVYGDEAAGERIIDAQYWSGTEYVDAVFGSEPAVFGVNFADGRIKGYPRDGGPGGTMRQFARYVRGNADYGVNQLTDNGDGTVTDLATGLMWMQADNGDGLIWEDALAFAEALTAAGYDDWRLPNAKELQTIVDYTRSPSTTGSPAINPLFACTAILNEAGDPDYPCYWTSTTHANWTATPGCYAAYVAFGRAMGYFGPPGMEDWVDVHGAGAQRSDPKQGDPNDWPYGHGPQGDAIRIFNYVRCVRDADSSSSEGDLDLDGATRLGLRIAPNPTLAQTTVRFRLPTAQTVTLEIVAPGGRCVRALHAGTVSAGEQAIVWDGLLPTGRSASPGIYFARLRAAGRQETARLIVAR